MLRLLRGKVASRNIQGVKRSFFRTKHPELRCYATYKRFGNAQPTFNLRNLLYSRNALYTGLGLVGFCIYNLDEAPFTKRWRILWIPYWLETKIGDFGYKQLMLQYRNEIIPYSDPIYNRISGIMNRLLTVALENSEDPKQKQHLKSLNWTIHVIQVDPNRVPPNAFILPNGKIFVFSSILPICQNDDGIATVLSHELSHQLAHHSLEQMSKLPFYLVLLTVLYSITGTNSLSGLLIDGLLRMPASREMESEADHIGCELMARLCFNLEEAVRFWGRMHDWEDNAAGFKAYRSGFQEFFSTHPNTLKRIHDIKQWLPELESVKELSGCYEYQYKLFNDYQHNFFGRRI